MHSPTQYPNQYPSLSILLSLGYFFIFKSAAYAADFFLMTTEYNCIKMALISLQLLHRFRYDIVSFSAHFWYYFDTACHEIFCVKTALFLCKYHYNYYTIFAIFS